MSSLLEGLSQTWLTIQGTLFSWLKEELGELTEKQQKLITVLEVIRLENYLSNSRGFVGCPLSNLELLCTHQTNIVGVLVITVFTYF